MIRLSYIHKFSAIAVDGLKSSGYDSLSVENHHRLFGGDNKALEQGAVLEKIVPNGFSVDFGLIIPSPTFNALHFMQHTYAHARCGGFALRQLVDYYLLLRVHNNDIDWDYASNIINRYGDLCFSNAIFQIMSTHLSNNIMIPVGLQMDNNLIVNNLLYDMVHHNDIRKQGIQVFSHRYASRWYYRYFKHPSWALAIFEHIALCIKCRIKQ